MLEYWEGISASGKHSIIYYADLDDSFCKMFIEALQPGKLSCSSNADMRAYKETVKYAAHTAQKLALSASNNSDPQQKVAKELMGKLVERKSLEALLDSIDSLSKRLQDPFCQELFTEPSSAYSLSLILQCFTSVSSKQPEIVLRRLKSVDFGSKFDFATCASFSNTFLSCIKLIRDNKTGLASGLVKELTDYFSNNGASLCSFSWACYLGLLAEGPDAYVAIAQKAIDHGVLGRIPDMIAAGLRGDLAFDLFTSFFTMFEIYRLDDFASIISGFALTLSSGLVDEFISNEEVCDPLMNLCLDNFPLNIPSILPILASLAATRVGARFVDNMLQRVSNLVLSERPPIDALYEDGDSYIVAHPFHVLIFGAEMIIQDTRLSHKPNSSTLDCKLAYSGWDLLARIFSANIHHDLELCIHIANLFTATFRSDCLIAEDLNAFLKRISPLYLESQGHCITDRLIAAAADSTLNNALLASVLECLEACPISELNESMVDLVIYLSNFASNISLKFDTDEEDRTGLLAVFNLLSTWISLINDESIVKSLLMTVGEALDRLLPCIDISLTFKLGLVISSFKMVHSSPHSCEDFSSNLQRHSLNFLLSAEPCELTLQYLELVEILACDFDIACFQGYLQKELCGASVLELMILNSFSTKSFFEKVISILASLFQSTQEPLPVSKPTFKLLSEALGKVENLDLVCNMVFSLGNENMNLFSSIVASSKNRILEHLASSKSGTLSFLHLVHSHITRPALLVEFSKLFPGSMKDMWALIFKSFEHAIMAKDSEEIALLCEIFSRAILKPVEEMDLNLFWSQFAKCDHDTLFCEVADYSDLYRPFSDLLSAVFFFGKLDKSMKSALIKGLKKDSNSPEFLTAIAKSCLLLNKNAADFPELVNAVCESFEAVSSAGAIIMEQDGFQIWSNFILIALGAKLSDHAVSGLAIMIRLACSHVSMNPGEFLPRVLLLFGCLLVNSKFGSIAVQFLRFYHLTEKLVHVLALQGNHELLPAYFENEGFSKDFITEGGLVLLCQELAKHPADYSLWQSFLLLARIEEFKCLVGQHLPFEQVKSKAPNDLLTDVLLLLVPASVNLFDMAYHNLVLKITHCSWSLLEDTRLSAQHRELLLTIISRLLLDVIDSEHDLKHRLVQVAREHLPSLTARRNDMTTEIPELVLALMEITQ